MSAGDCLRAVADAWDGQDARAGLSDAFLRERAGARAGQLRDTLRRLAQADQATPQDLQLLAALDRWAAGDLT